MNWLESIIYGFVSGLAEVLPISSTAHQILCLKLMGVAQRQPVRDLMVHIGILAAIIFSLRDLIGLMRRELSLASRRSRLKRNTTFRTISDIRLLRAGVIPLIVVLIFRFLTFSLEYRLPLICLFLIINGIIIIVPEHLRQSNKSAKDMSVLDGLLIGAVGGLSVFPGISRIGTSFGYATVRGADKEKSFGWMLFLSIPALLFYCFFDCYLMISRGAAIYSFVDFIFSVFSGLTAFGAAYLAILIFKRFFVRTGSDWFAYYSWGAAIFVFVLYLIA